MASKPAASKKTEELEMADETDTGLDQAIDDLRGVLKKDTSVPETGLDEPFGMIGDDENADPLAPGGFGADFEDSSSEPDMMFQNTASPAAEPAAALFGPDLGEEAGHIAGETGPGNLDLILDIPIDMQIVLGTSRLPVSSLMNLSEGALIGLDRKIGEPVDIMVNGRLFGRGEITVLESEESRFGIKLIEVMGESGK
jgi:flagellar motor switch protein FliN/FliY